MDSKVYNALIATLKRCPYDASKFETLDAALNLESFLGKDRDLISLNQVAGILKCFSYDHHRANALYSLYMNIDTVRKIGMYDVTEKILPCFDFDAGKMKALEIAKANMISEDTNNASKSNANSNGSVWKVDAIPKWVPNKKEDEKIERLINILNESDSSDSEAEVKEPDAKKQKKKYTPKIETTGPKIYKFTGNRRFERFGVNMRWETDSNFSIHGDRITFGHRTNIYINDQKWEMEDPGSVTIDWFLPRYDHAPTLTTANRNTNTNTSTTGRGAPENVDPFAALQEVKDEKVTEGTPESMACTICQERVRSIMIEDCKHVFSCASCIRDMKLTDPGSKCPICRKGIKGVSKFFMV